MGNTSSINKINFEDILFAQNNLNQYIIINTLPINKQHCLIYGTCLANNESNIINNLIKNYKQIEISIIIYGENSMDSTPFIKYEQLIGLGFTNIFVYSGGLFEWLLLQDVYGNDEFKTTSNELDLLQFRGNKKIDIKYLEY